MRRASLFFKRLFDILVAGLLLIVLFPALIACALLIALFNGFPILFTQARPGLNEKIFKIYKFRTMQVVGENHLKDHQRMTRLGAILRKTSLDELPQLFNVLIGNLSLVGPRPLLVEYLPLYNQRQRLRHSVKPGITGWAQINGRNTLSWEQKFDFDIWYVENWSLALDIKILFLTFLKVINRSDVNSSATTTMDKFEGSKHDN